MALLDLWNTLPQQNQQVLISLFYLGLVLFVVYLLVISLQRYLEYHRSVYFLRMTLDEASRKYVDSSQYFTKLFTVLYQNESQDIMTFEYHKSVDHTELLFSSHSKDRLEYLASLLSEQEGLRADILEDEKDPLLRYPAKKMVTRSFYAKKQYASFSTRSNSFCNDLQHLSKYLGTEDCISVVVCFRSAAANTHLEQRIARLRHTLYSSKTKVINPSKQHRIEQLSRKNDYVLYTTGIAVVASSTTTASKATGLLNTLFADNRLYSTSVTLDKKRIRFVPRWRFFSERLSVVQLRKTPLFNAQELGCWLYL